MTYEEHKNILRQKAIEFQTDLSANTEYNMILYLVRTNYFKKMANRYGLVKEFKENGII